MSKPPQMIIKDPAMLFWALDDDLIILPEGEFIYTIGDGWMRTAYLTKVGDDGEETFIHVRDKDGVALLPRLALIDILLTKQYTVS